jgi:hypothetical protein
MVLPEIQQLARQHLQLFLHLVLHCGGVRSTGGLLRIGSHGPGLILQSLLR